MNNDQKRIIAISDHLQIGASEVRILRSITWPKEVKEEFFRHKAQRAPDVTYPAYDASGVLDHIKKLKKKLSSEDPIDQWAYRIASKIESSALMLESRGTHDFFRHSVDLYGKPSQSMKSTSDTTLELARHFDDMFSSVKDHDLGEPPEACVLAGSLAEEMTKVVKENFGEHAPDIVMDTTLASNALAGRQRVSIRPNACFTDKDVNQLIQHELFVHVATSINGHLQPHIKILGEGHAGTTKTQEGLAVFAEFITGSIDLDRVRRLSDRVLAIQMAIEGADFMEVYRYYLEKTDSPEQSFESAKRVFRGGVMSGKAPFTKDIVYLEGLLLVHSFLRIAISQRKLEYLDLLFVGKLDVTDLPVLKQLSAMGMIDRPKFVPPWIRDKRYLLSFLTYSSFLNSVDIGPLSAQYEELLKEE